MHTRGYICAILVRRGLARRWEFSVKSHSLLHPCWCYLYLAPSDCRVEQGCIWHRYYRESPMQAGPRGWAVHRLCAAKPGYDCKVCGTQFQSLNPAEAIKPFIFYVWVSWLSYCWRRRDTGPTSQEPQQNYSIWIIHRTWGWYLSKGQTCLYCPPAVKLKAAWMNNGQTQVPSIGCGKHDLISSSMAGARFSFPRPKIHMFGLKRNLV